MLAQWHCTCTAKSVGRARAAAAPHVLCSQWALELQRTMQDLFWDPEGGAYFNNKARDQSVSGVDRVRFQRSVCGLPPARMHAMQPAFCAGIGAAAVRVARPLLPPPACPFT